MTTSGSMPFSFASASMVCCSGLAMFTPGFPAHGSFPVDLFRRPAPDDSQLHDSQFPRLLELDLEVRPGDDADRHAVPPAVFLFDDHDEGVVVVLRAAEPPLEIGLPVDRLTHDQLRAPPCEAAVVVRPP